MSVLSEASRLRRADEVRWDLRSSSSPLLSRLLDSATLCPYQCLTLRLLSAPGRSDDPAFEEENPVTEANPAHADHPALFRAEVGVSRRRWTMAIIGPDLALVVGPNIDLGPAEELTMAHPDDPGRYLIAISGEVPVLPREQAVQVLRAHGYVVEAAALDDAKTDHGWTQLATTEWTAPCQPIAP